MKTLRLALAALVALPLVAAEPPSPEALASQARSLAGNLMLSLQGELFAAMKDGGPAKAVDVCRVRAPGIAAATATGTPWKIGRTALKVRNPQNAPDAWEAAKLEEFRKRLASGEELKAIEVFEVVQTGDRPIFRYMKAIGTASPCLNCHGASLAPEIAAKVKELYPEDQAVGFAAGQLRGAFTLSRPL
ncbi:MAG: DUF3365 domain-containing protein [Holophagales bacterium]|nr:DUF3365 domain-containing protein [Holophagales bacterium]